MKFTEEQQKIFHFVKLDSNHGIIDAVAGSGKTTTIIESIVFAAQNKKLLFCAFNRKIRNEIQYRVNEKGHFDIATKTLHQLGFDILKMNSQFDYNPIDNKKYDKLVNAAMEKEFVNHILKLAKLHKIVSTPRNDFEKNILKEFQFTIKKQLKDACDKFRLTLTPNNLKDFKAMLIHYSIIDLEKTSKDIIDSVVEILFECTQTLIKNGNIHAKKNLTIDFTDMIYLPSIFKLYPTKLYDILFVDECQDLSKAQFQIAMKYVKKNGRVLAVGDPYQSIYGFTGADINSFKRFTKSLKGHIKLTLSKCFRCPDCIIEYAQNYRSDIEAFNPKDGKIEKIEFNAVLNNIKPGDLVICRVKAALIKLLFDLLEANRKVNIHPDDVNDLFGELRMLFKRSELNQPNIADNYQSFFQKVKRRQIWITEKKSKKIKNRLQREEFLREEKDYINRKLSFLENQLLYHTDVININELIKRIESLIVESEEAIKLSTIHKAKGLENDRVFILDYDKLPFNRSSHKVWEAQQEKNLTYVALTRAKSELYLVDSEKDDSSDAAQGSLFDELDIID